MNKKTVFVILAALLIVITALLTTERKTDAVKPKIRYEPKSEWYYKNREQLYTEWFGEAFSEKLENNAEEVFWLDAISTSPFALVAGLEDYYERDGFGYWVFKGINLVYGEYGSDKLVIESGPKGDGGYEAFEKFEIGKVYLITVWTEKYCDYAPKCPYVLSGGTFIDISNPENCSWEGGNIIFPKGTKKESIIDYISDLAVTYGYDGVAFE